ncbi:unnamed protein product [Blepharisma stoltei]|uniref:Uncharacterized protein n=1 Tax=Blepharisma stoltei TaxID=1481888 RepID=A0AAU9IV73_9CILI|nr:unnamed protein product [Blepharisma stoltei]
MSIRAQAPIAAVPVILQNINKVRYKSNGRPAAPRSSSLDNQRKFYPRVNKSFTCYQDMPLTLHSNKNRSFSTERPRNISLGEISPSYKLSTVKNLPSTSKLISGHPRPKDLEEARNKKESLTALLERGKSEMKLGQYLSGLKFFKKAVKEEPSNPEALYDIANCYICLGEHKKAIPDLLSLSRDYPYYNRQVYTALALCFVTINDNVTAIRQLSRGLIKFPKHSEAYILRGQLYNKQEKYDKAVMDFYKAISLNPAEGSAYLGLSDALIGMNDIPTAIKILSQAAQCEGTEVQAYLSKGKLNYNLQNYENAINDFDLAINVQKECAEAYYYKSLVLLNQDKLIDAALCLEQVIKFDSLDKNFTGAAIYNLGIIHIKQRDFYGAFYTFKRATDINLEIKEQRILKAYVDGVLCLMKRKFKEGVALLTRIIKKKNPLLKEYFGNCYAYRGYGYASLENHERSVRDFTASGKIQKLDNASEYNLMISQAIITFEKDADSALKLFKAANEKFPKNVEPFAYEAAVLLHAARRHKKILLADQAKDLLTKAIEFREAESDLYFFRGVTSYYLDKPIESIHDYEEAIEKADDNVPIHFIARGLCYIQLKLIQEAIQDFTIALQLDENLAEAYYYRGRCAFLTGDTTLAFLDFQKLILAKPKDPLVHVYAGNLLMLTGSVDDAAKAYSNSCSIEPTKTAHYQKAKCFLMLGSITEAIEELEKAQKIEVRLEVSFDLEILNVIKEAYNKDDLESSLKKSISRLSKALQLHTEGEVCSLKHLHNYKGIFFFFLGEFQKSQAEFKQAFGENEKVINDEEEDMKISSEILLENSEIIYNLALCYIMEEYYEAGFIHLNELLKFTEGPNKGKVLLLMGILQLALEQSEHARQLMLEGYKYDQDLVSAYLEEKPDIKILPFQSDSEYASKFSMAKISIGECHPVLVRPSFSLPKPLLPSMEFQTEDFIFSHFTVKSVKCKPEAPWLNRVKGAIQFTEKVQDIISETVSESEEESVPTQISSVFDNNYDKRAYKSVGYLPSHFESELEIRAEDTANLFEAYINKQINISDMGKKAG